MIANLKVGKTIKARTYLTTPFAPQNPFAPWGNARRRNACKRLLHPNSLIDRYSIHIERGV